MITFVTEYSNKNTNMKTTKMPLKQTKETPKKRVSKAWKAAMKYQGCFDKEEVLKFAHT